MMTEGEQAEVGPKLSQRATAPSQAIACVSAFAAIPATTRITGVRAPASKTAASAARGGMLEPRKKN